MSAAMSEALSATDAAFQKKIYGSGTAALIITTIDYFKLFEIIDYFQ